MRADSPDRECTDPTDVDRVTSGRRHLSDRGVSTVVDATLALLLISASAVLLGSAIATDRDRLDPEAADHVAETLAAATVHANYSRAAVRGRSAFPPEDYTARQFDRQDYGPAPEVLASAAMYNLTVDGRSLSAGSDAYTGAVAGSVLERLSGVGYGVGVVALWRPYENASLGGRVAVGPWPPADADVGTAVLGTASGIDLTGSDVEAAYGRRDSYGDAADLIADAVVERYLPPAETQRALERGGPGRALAVYRYRRLASVLRDAGAGDVSFDPGDPGDPLAGNGSDPATPDASAANAALADGLSAVVEADLRATFTRDEMSTDLADAVWIGRVRIVVRVWES